MTLGEVVVQPSSQRTVFFSYAREDADWVSNAAQLILASGADIFLDTSSIQYGFPWKQALLTGIVNCERMMVFWSKHAAASEWVSREWRYALTLGKPVVPVPLDDTPLPPELAEFQSFNRMRNLLLSNRGVDMFLKNPPLEDRIRELLVVRKKLADEFVDLLLLRSKSSDA